MTMTTAFLLRFQELPGVILGAGRGSKSTFQSAQSVTGGKTAIPVAGTRTITEVKREQSDNDPHSRRLHIFPLQADCK